METYVITSQEKSTESQTLERPSCNPIANLNNLDRTDWQQIGSSLSMPKTEQSQTNRPESIHKEKISEWWMGRVLNVYKEEGYFEASLEDSNGIQCIAEFDIDTELEQDIFQKARFVFYVFTRHGQGSPETANQIEFIPPNIWTKEDKKEMEEIHSELFPDRP
jgi:hypothetical protein